MHHHSSHLPPCQLVLARLQYGLLSEMDVDVERHHDHGKVRLAI